VRAGWRLEDVESLYLKGKLLIGEGSGGSLINGKKKSKYPK
jgi:hypothetical protein